jgi:hypothetical protein
VALSVGLHPPQLNYFFGGTASVWSPDFPLAIFDDTSNYLVYLYNLVEAMGIEPMSALCQTVSTPCSAFVITYLLFKGIKTSKVHCIYSYTTQCTNSSVAVLSFYNTRRRKLIDTFFRQGIGLKLRQQPQLMQNLRFARSWHMGKSYS